MASSSGVRRIGARQYASVAANLGVSLPIPDGRAWPEDVRVWFHKATGECGPLDVFIFNHGQVACMYLQDAVTAAAILEVDASEWFTERGYPIFCSIPNGSAKFSTGWASSATPCMCWSRRKGQRGRARASAERC